MTEKMHMFIKINDKKHLLMTTKSPQYVNERMYLEKKASIIITKPARHSVLQLHSLNREFNVDVNRKCNKKTCQLYSHRF